MKLQEFKTHGNLKAHPIDLRKEKNDIMTVYTSVKDEVQGRSGLNTKKFHLADNLRVFLKELLYRDEIHVFSL
jgi:hypothetical protein